MPSKNQIEAAALCMEHLCEHDWHGYTQAGGTPGRWGDGEGTCPVNTPIGTCYVEQGDRDCSSAVISAYEAAGISCGGATYTGNMYDCMVGTGNFRGHWCSDGYNCDDGYVAKRGDCYVNTGSHTAMCVSAVPDLLAEFCIAEDGGIYGRTGDQTGWESVTGRDFYGYPWNWVLEVISTDDPEPTPTPTPTPLPGSNMHGIDVSSHDEAPYKWHTEQCYNGSDFVIVKITQGTWYVNPCFDYAYNRAKNDGKLLGIYHYAGDEGAREEAEYFFDHVEQYIGEFIPVLDWESYNNEHNWGDTNWCRQFCDRFHELSGVWPMIYTSASAIWQAANCADVCPLWVACYDDDFSDSWNADFDDYPYEVWPVWPWNDFAVWQYTSDGGTDRNVARIDGATWNALAGGGVTPGPKSENICLSDANGSDEQCWRVIWASDKEWFNLVNVKNGLALDVKAASDKSGTQVWTYEPNGSDAQLWKLVEIDDPKYEPQEIRPVLLIPKVNDKLRLDVYAASVNNGTMIQVWEKNNTPAQQWVIKDIGNGVWELLNNVKQSKAITLGDPTFPAPVNKAVCYRVSTDVNGRSWYDEMQDGKDTGGSSDDYAGEYGSAIRWLAVKDATYRVYTIDSGWLPWVSQYNINDLENGCAGDGSPILGVEVKDNNVRYAVHVIGGSWYSDMIGQKDTGGSGDTYAGDLSSSIDAIRMRRN